MATQVFRNDTLNIDVWVKELYKDGNYSDTKKIQFAVSDSDRWKYTTFLEKACSMNKPVNLFDRCKRYFKVIDYMMYGFADYQDDQKGIDYGDEVIVSQPRNEQLKLIK